MKSSTNSICMRAFCELFQKTDKRKGATDWTRAATRPDSYLIAGAYNCHPLARPPTHRPLTTRHFLLSGSNRPVCPSRLRYFYTAQSNADKFCPFFFTIVSCQLRGCLTLPGECKPCTVWTGEVGNRVDMCCTIRCRAPCSGRIINAVHATFTAVSSWF